MKNIEVKKIIDPVLSSDGAGVKLKRSIGIEPNYFDPFLMLDEFGSDNRDDYVGDIHISKTEAGKESSTERKSMTYVMEKAWPYQIDAIPLQFGSSQITKVTANFKYERHYTMTQDIKNAPQLTRGEELLKLKKVVL